MNGLSTSFPTMEALAEAEENDLLKMWEGLGYYSRARNLQAGVREVVENYGGEVPSNRTEISTLKGVGPYTAGAVLSIAYGVPEHAVDGNVMRVISRLLLIEEDIAIPRTKKIFETVVMDLIDKEDPSSFNQGLMELGATICTPKPKCLLCPVRDFCLAFQEGRQEELPVKTKKTKMKIIPVASFAIRNSKVSGYCGNALRKVCLQVCGNFQWLSWWMIKHHKKWLHEHFGIELKGIVDILSFKHIFSHLTWEMKSFRSTD